jgi:hypothetical protein
VTERSGLAGTGGGKGSSGANASLVRGRYVLCKARNDRELAVVQDGAVLQADGRIEAVGAYDDLARRYPGLDTIGCPRHVVIPGLVNTHHHVDTRPFSSASPTCRSSCGSRRDSTPAAWTDISIRSTPRSN